MSTSPGFNVSGVRLILAFVIGPYDSRVSYSVLTPGKSPEIRHITDSLSTARSQAPARANIPSVIYYDPCGKARAIGFETAHDSVSQMRKQRAWIKAERFMPHPDRLTQQIHGKSDSQIMSDFLSYLVQWSSVYIQATDPDSRGINLMRLLDEETDYIFTPSGDWEQENWDELLRSAILAGITSDTPKIPARVFFISRQATVLHEIIRKKSSFGRSLKDGEHVMILLLSGTKIHASTHRRLVGGSINMPFQPVASSEASLDISSVASVHARMFFERSLSGSRFSSKIDLMVKDFREKVLPFFRRTTTQYVKFGSPHDNDVKYNITSGALKLLGPEVAFFFESSVDYIIKTAFEQEQVVKKKISHVVLLRPYGLPNEWMIDSISSRLSATGMRVVTMDDYRHGPELLNSAILSYMDLTEMERATRAQEDGRDGEQVTGARELDGFDGP